MMDVENHLFHLFVEENGHARGREKPSLTGAKLLVLFKTGMMLGLADMSSSSIFTSCPRLTSTTSTQSDGIRHRRSVQRLTGFRKFIPFTNFARITASLCCLAETAKKPQSKVCHGIVMSGFGEIFSGGEASKVNGGGRWT